MTKNDVDFFYRNAGFSYDPKKETKAQGQRRNAKELAKAEQYALDHDWSYEWEYDQDPDTSWMDDESRTDYEAGRLEVLDVLLRDAEGNVLASLGGVAVYPRTIEGKRYIRVVEAELALEAMP